jgi:hypothetical protein
LLGKILVNRWGGVIGIGIDQDGFDVGAETNTTSKERDRRGKSAVDG